MSRLTESYQHAVQTKDALIGTAKNKVIEAFPYVILVLNIAFAVISCLFKTWLVNPFSAVFFIDLVSNILLTMFSYASFLQYAEKIEKTTNAAYRTNCSAWSVISERIRVGHAESFFEYCKEQTNKEREDKRREMILNKTMLPYDTYLEKYHGKRKDVIAEYRANGEITREEERIINKANGDMHVKPIKPLLIFCGIRLSHLNDAGRQSVPSSVISIASRPVVMLFLTALLKMFTGSYVGVESASVIFDMIYSIMLIVVSSFFGFSAGTKSARDEHEKIKARIFFLERFEKSKA